MYAYNATTTGQDFGRSADASYGASRYPMYYPHPHLVPAPPAPALPVSSSPAVNPAAYHSTYPANTTFGPEAMQAPGILRTPSRNRAAAAARARSATPARRSRSRSASARRVSFADGLRPGSVEAHREPRVRVERHRRTSSSSSNGSPAGRSRRQPSRLGDHHYNLGVPADPYANVRKVIPFLPGPPAPRHAAHRDDADDRLPRRRQSRRRNDDHKDSRRRRSRHAGRTH